MLVLNLPLAFDPVLPGGAELHWSLLSSPDATYTVAPRSASLQLIDPSYLSGDGLHCEIGLSVPHLADFELPIALQPTHSETWFL